MRRGSQRHPIERGQSQKVSDSAKILDEKNYNNNNKGGNWGVAGEDEWESLSGEELCYNNHQIKSFFFLTQ